MFMKLAGILAISLFLFVHSASAQNTLLQKQGYTSAVGIKFYPVGVSFKHFVAANKAVDLYAYFQDGTRVTGLYEFHGSLSNTGGLKWYAGPGTHIHFYDYEHGGGVNAGVDGVVGLEYKLNKLPFAFSIDWQPSIEFGSKATFAGGWGGIGGKFTF